MDWKHIRSAFIRTRGRRTQEQVATGAGLRQNAISKLEANDNKGPSVETFIKAIEGLGLPASTFFARLEHAAEPPQVADHESLPPLASDQGIAEAVVRRLTERIDTLERRLRTHTRVPPKNNRHVATARPQAAERSPARGSGRARHAQRQKRPKTNE